MVRDMQIEWDGWRVPPKFASDGCSVPFFLRPALAIVYALLAMKESRYVAACIWHDWARRHLVHYGLMTVQEADWAMRNYLRALGMKKWLAQVFWLGVKIMRPWFRKTRPIPYNSWKPFLQRRK